MGDERKDSGARGMTDQSINNKEARDENVWRTWFHKGVDVAMAVMQEAQAKRMAILREKFSSIIDKAIASTRQYECQSCIGVLKARAADLATTGSQTQSLAYYHAAHYLELITNSNATIPELET